MVVDSILSLQWFIAFGVLQASICSWLFASDIQFFTPPFMNSRMVLDWLPFRALFSSNLLSNLTLEACIKHVCSTLKSIIEKRLQIHTQLLSKLRNQNGAGRRWHFTAETLFRNRVVVWNCFTGKTTKAQN